MLFIFPCLPRFYIILCLFVINVTSCYAGEIVTVRAFSIDKAVWTRPKDGTSPTLVSWKSTIAFDNGVVLKKNHSAAEGEVLQRFSAGETFEVLSEDFFIDSIKQAWYKIRHVDSRAEFEYFGLPSRKPVMSDSSEGSHTVIVPNIVTDGDTTKVRFWLDNLIVSMPVTDIKHHGIYAGQGLAVLGEVIIPHKDPHNNAYNYRLILQEAGSDRVFEVESAFVKDSQHVSIAYIGVENEKRWEELASFGFGDDTYLSWLSWDVVIFNEHGDRFIYSMKASNSFESHQRYNGGYARPQAYNPFPYARSIEVVSETFDYKNFISIFGVKMTGHDQVWYVRGEPRAMSLNR